MPARRIAAVRVKSVEQQGLRGLHSIRSLWMGTRTSRIYLGRIRKQGDR